VGSYSDASGKHGFLLDHGNYVTLDVRGSGSTSANAINDSGQIVGTYTDTGGTHGFLLNQDSYTALDGPGSTLTCANGINDSGQIVGAMTMRAADMAFSPPPALTRTASGRAHDRQRNRAR
jgi:probable HAF family extracellular repeat protein